jgi:acetyltransferase-like isoleucine patch superfamily enzyme
MLSGKSFKLFSHGCLQEDIVACQAAVSEYNRAAISANVPPATDRAKMFNRILDKLERTANPNRNERKYAYHRPTGDIGDRTIVQPPFRCDFGWHVHLGEDCVVGSGCYLQDAGGIYIGDQVIIGPDVLILTMRPDMRTDVSMKGSFGLFKAGSVKIEDHVEIGAGATIYPYVTIGKNARVEPGAVVTKVSILLTTTVPALR